MTLTRAHLPALEQVPDRFVSRAIGHCLWFIFSHLLHNGKSASLSALLAECDHELAVSSLDVLALHREPDGFFKRPRMVEVAAALNRIRGLTVE